MHVDHKGNFRTVAAFTSEFGAPRISPDGRLVASKVQGEILLYDLHRGITTALIREKHPILTEWTPDGKRLVFGLFKSGAFNLFSINADGSSPMEQLTNNMNRS